MVHWSRLCSGVPQQQSHLTMVDKTHYSAPRYQSKILHNTFSGVCVWEREREYLECAYKAAANESTLHTKLILIHSNHLPACEREGRIKEKEKRVCLQRSHLFCRMAFDSAGRLRRSLDISKGWRRVANKRSLVLSQSHSQTILGMWHSQAYRCKDGPHCHLCFLLIQTQTKISNNQLQGDEREGEET